MNKQKKQIIGLGVCLLLALFPLLVSAKNTDSDGQVCVGGMIYTIQNAGSNVQLSKITQRDIINSCYQSGGNTNTCPKEDYFEAVSLGISCGITEGNIGDDKYTFYSCPLEQDISKVTPMNELNSNANFSQVWDSSRSQWKVTIQKAEGYRVKRVTKQNTSGNQPAYRETCTSYDDSGNCQVYEFPGNNWLTNNDGVIQFWVNPGDDYFLAFYLGLGGGNPCNGAYMGYIQGAGSTSIPNPIYNKQICKDYRNQVNGTDKVGIATNLVSECFEEEMNWSNVDQYTDQKVREDIDRAKNILTRLSTGKVEDHLQCYFDKNRNSNTSEHTASSQEYTQFLEGVGGTYWGALCTEKLEITYEQPKGLSAGQGFSYSPVINMTRTCTPVQLRQPEYKPQCAYSVECWGGPANHTGQAGAGPTSSFDQCVASCDGGKYTQDCIDQCYKMTYPNNIPIYNTQGLFSKLTLSANPLQAVPVSTTDLSHGSNKTCAELIGKPYGRTRLPISSCYVTDSNYGCPTNTYCVSEHGISFTYLDGCNSNTNPTLCYEVFVTSPNCVIPPETPESAYRKEVEKSEAELQNVLNAINQYTTESFESLDKENPEKFSASVVDSHTGKVIEYKDATDTTVIKEVTNYTENNTTRDYEVKMTENHNETIGIPGHYQVEKEVRSYEVKRQIKLYLDESYVSSINVGDIRYGRKQFEVNPDLLKYYYQGGRRFYSNINALGYNLYEKWPTVTSNSEEAIKDGNFASQGITQNIHYNFSGLGSWGQWSSIDLDCFYGIKDNTGIYLNPGCTACAPGEANCIDTCGLTYIYRPINLNQPFLEEQQDIGRNPRWNWTTSANSLRYNIMPDETRLEIIRKGDTIYETSNQENDPSEELDYEIVLTKQNINAIRQYNREHNGEYLDYDMYCYSDTKLGINVCQSKFLNGGANSDYDVNGTSSYYMDLKKRGMVGCNNQKGNVCERKYVDMRGGNQ